jgi:hypothetical protein
MVGKAGIATYGARDREDCPLAMLAMHTVHLASGFPILKMSSRL